MAAGCWLYKDAAGALRHGRIDPDNQAKTSIKEIMEVISTAKAAPAICKNTINIVLAAKHGRCGSNCTAACASDRDVDLHGAAFNAVMVEGIG